MGGEGGCRTGLYGTSFACASSIFFGGANGRFRRAFGGLVGIGMEVVAVGGFLLKNLGDPKSSKYVFNQDKDVMFTYVVACR